MAEPQVSIALRLTAALAARLRRACERLDESEGALIRAALEAHLDQLEARVPREARTREGADERLLADLRPLVATALRAAATWEVFREALRAHDLDVTPAGGGLAVVMASTGRRLCKISEAGPGYAALIARFGRGFPGHPHRWLERKVLTRPQPRSLVEDGGA